MTYYVSLRQVSPEVVDMRENSSYEWEVSRKISYNACKPLITKGIVVSMYTFKFNNESKNINFKAYSFLCK